VVVRPLSARARNNSPGLLRENFSGGEKALRRQYQPSHQPL
jgi:hypothetical protein